LSSDFALILDIDIKTQQNRYHITPTSLAHIMKENSAQHKKKLLGRSSTCICRPSGRP